MSANDILAGAIFEIAYPFVIEEVSMPPDDPEGGPYTMNSWRPGVRYEQRMGAWGEPTTDSVADGVGKQIITVISTHKPGRFPMRVFYTRLWEAPNGRRFGKSNCRVASITGFRSLIKGYRHEVDRVGQIPDSRALKRQEG